MRFTLLLTILAGVAGMTGCAPAVAIHPLFTTQDLVSDLPLEGTWASSDARSGRSKNWKMVTKSMPRKGRNTWSAWCA